MFPRFSFRLLTSHQLTRGERYFSGPDASAHVARRDPGDWYAKVLIRRLRCSCVVTYKFNGSKLDGCFGELDDLDLMTFSP